MRKSLEDTWNFLESQGKTAPRHLDGTPLIHEMMPNFDDEELRLSYFSYRLENANNGDLTMPRTFFGRSGFIRVRFANSDLSQSRMCWNDFEECDFSSTDLSGCDMRASKFINCSFIGANLANADLRRSFFKECDFTDADLTNAIVEDEDAEGCVQDWLAKEQCDQIAWADDEGPEPPGG